MTLRVALDHLPDDRATKSAVRHVLMFLVSHSEQPLDFARVSRATGVDVHKVEEIMRAFRAAFVIDCGGSGEPCVFRPSGTLTVEVQRFLRSATVPDVKLQRGLERFRNRHDGGSGV